ncbi:hypothetical protein BOTBODRAFT_182064 [Botryobasidium botryosum FD-172 SS1]|uniref:DUF6532 domain-containing protein n=1 Tax=Botryobasidium botryosum (strain FD-172 SS1) TaxID=930990 RepID=A0A067M250_BOTB1|nr:hypothetical protein BOTBODRAFT_182064 [Botryobasidium botryosum FD-172 SS1]
MIRVRPEKPVKVKKPAKAAKPNSPAPADDDPTTAPVASEEIDTRTDINFKNIFLPTLFDYLGSTENPFIIPPATLAKKQQDTWALTYPPASHVTIRPKSPLFNIIKQKTHDWKSAIGKTTMTLLHEFWMVDGNIKAGIFKEEFRTPLDRATHVQWALGDEQCVPFGWRDPETLEGPFCSEIVLKTLAHHLEATTASATDHGVPRGALALSTAAVQRALTAWKTGVWAQPTHFSKAYWGELTGEYAEDVAELDDGQWADIIKGARVFCKAKGGVSGQAEAGKKKRRARIVAVPKK